MDKKFERESKRLIINLVLLIGILLSTCFLSIGYAALQSVTLHLDGKIATMPLNDLLIIDAKLNEAESTNPDILNSIIEQYFETKMQSIVVLSDDMNSTVAYDVTIYNGDNEVHIFDKVEYTEEFYDNPNIKFELQGLSHGDKIYPKQTLTFTVTFSYVDGTIRDNKVLHSLLHYVFDHEAAEDDGLQAKPLDMQIYDVMNTTIPVELSNNNTFNATVDIKFNDKVLATEYLESYQTKTVDISISDIYKELSTGKKYKLSINQKEPNVVGIESDVKFSIAPTITNYTLGLQDAGTEEKPYEIYKIEDLIRLALQVNNKNGFEGVYIKQISTLDFEDQNSYYNYVDTGFGDLNNNDSDLNTIMNEMTTGTGYIRIGNAQGIEFHGIYDGNNNEIKNLYINDNDETDELLRAGLFGYINNATIKNLILRGEINCRGDGGAFVGGAYGNCKIINCHNYVEMYNERNGYCLGGIVGIGMNGSVLTIEKCHNYGDISNYSVAGGIMGFTWNSTLTVTDCYNEATITSVGTGKECMAGGIVGKEKDTDSSAVTRTKITRSNNKGRIQAYNHAGGIVSQILGRLEISSSYNSGDVITATEAGGIVGLVSGHAEIANVYNVGIVEIMPESAMLSLISTFGLREEEVSPNSTLAIAESRESVMATALGAETSIGGIIGSTAKYNDQYQRIDGNGTYNIEKTYYLNNPEGLLAIGTDSSYKGKPQTETYMKSAEFATLLGSDFMMDTGINNGYPIIKY